MNPTATKLASRIARGGATLVDSQSRYWPLQRAPMPIEQAELDATFQRRRVDGAPGGFMALLTVTRIAISADWSVEPERR